MNYYSSKQKYQALQGLFAKERDGRILLNIS